MLLLLGSAELVEVLGSEEEQVHFLGVLKVVDSILPAQYANNKLQNMYVHENIYKHNQIHKIILEENF